MIKGFWKMVANLLCSMYIQCRGASMIRTIYASMFGAFILLAAVAPPAILIMDKFGL